MSFNRRSDISLKMKFVCLKRYKKNKVIFTNRFSSEMLTHKGFFPESSNSMLTCIKLYLKKL